MKKLLLAVVTVLCCAPAAFAGHPLITDLTETVAPKNVEAETAFEYSGKGGEKAFLLQETLTAGIVEKVDASLAIPFMSLSGGETHSGFSDMTLGVKWNFFASEHYSLAVKPFITLPTGDENKGLGEGNVGFGGILMATTELNTKLALDANFGFSHKNPKGGEVYNEFAGSVAGRYEATKELKAVGELTLATSDQSGSKVQSLLGIGAVYAVQKSLDVDLGVRFGLTKEADDYALLAGCTFKF